jgi:ATP-dependent helicase/nuclease subunit A
MNKPPQDQAAREAAEKSLHQTTFIAAGAGTGKTTTIVKRIVNALCDRESELLIKSLAAITFTERAAAELRRRIRSALQEQAENGNAKASHALANFDLAQIGTIHAFAKRILSSFPIEAGLPITFDVLDEATSKRSLRETASTFVANFFENLTPSQKFLMDQAEISPVALREFVLELNAKRLLVNESDIHSRRKFDPSQVAREFLSEISSWFDSQSSVWKGFTAGYITEIEAGLEDLSLISKESTELSFEQILRMQSALHKILYSRAGGPAAMPFKLQIRELFEGGFDGLEFAEVENFFREVLPEIWAGLQGAVSTRFKNGRLTFDDLIVLTSELIENNPDVRQKLHKDFKLIVVDEFQDTDPLQWKLISLITTPIGESAPVQGSLVLVGDAQQSIYSFRGADVATYLSVANKVGLAPMGGITETLEVNFRSNQKILNWANAAFSHSSIELGTKYVNLLSAERNLVSDDHMPGVSVLGGPDVEIDHRLESPYIASAAFQAVANGWQVFDRDLPGYRPAKYSDIVILIPARTSLEDLLEELTMREIPYRSSDSAIVFDRPVVRGLIDAMKVVAGIQQPLDLWFALKSPLFGCDDLELLEYKRLGGKWGLPYGEPSKELAATRVYQSLAILSKIRKTSNSSSPAAVMMQLLEETRVMSTYDRTPRGRFEIECIQMVMRQARSWAQGGGAGAVEYLSWISDQLSENAREALPETDDLGDDAVRISTVHGVKGLEFPIVILAGMARKRITPLPMISVKQNRFEFNVGQLKSHGYRRGSEKLELADRSAEQSRVLYVAATRARDHLIVSNLAKLNAKGETQSWSGLYLEAVAATVEAGLATRFDQFVEPVAAPKLTVQPVFAAESPDWIEKLPEIRAKSKEKNLVTPSTLGSKANQEIPLERVVLLDDTHQVATEYEDDDIDGSDVAKLGNAFHVVMEIAIQRRVREIDSNLLLAMKGALVEQGVPEYEERLKTMISTVFNHSVLDRIYSADKIMPELAISEINEDGVLVEGFADLVIQEGDSLVVMDYKTNLDLSQDKIDAYAKQLDAYAQIIQRATGLTVAEKVLVHVLTEKVELVQV